MKTGTFDYKHDDVTLEAFFASPETVAQPLPIIIICHAWAGRDQFACDKARALAELGYLGVAIDVYGKGVLGTSVEENTALITPFMQDRVLLRQRLLLGMEAAKTLANADSDKIAAIGYCFGGLCALDMARSGADLKGVVSFHGLLNAPDNLANAEIHAKIVALHGHDDPMVPPQQVLDFETEMTEANVDWQVHVYGQTQHAFTNPEANDNKMGTVYNATADYRAWLTLQNFLVEIFA
ncbi:MAG: dienelactone hydrolase family protein [Gammaproteobacteria bacterium]|nr:dienelactone hydrolase family protein [Gammaproteobacteria bacterium]